MIMLTAPETYTATLGGVEWSNITPASPMWGDVQGMIADGADPLFFKWQAGEGTEAEWLAKREEIRTRFPYPSE